MHTCVVIPTYMEEDNIGEVISVLVTNCDVDILVVDDSSPDLTSKIVLDWKEKSNSRVALLSNPIKSGLGRAYLDGFLYCLDKGYDIICAMDADLSHDPRVLETLIAPILNGEADLVIGSRYVSGGSILHWSFIRRLISKTGNLYARKMLQLNINDVTGGYRVYKNELLRKITQDGISANGYGFQIEMTFFANRENARILEVPISFTERLRGKTKMTMKIIIEALLFVTYNGIKMRISKK